MTYPIDQPIREASAKLNSPFSETLKEIGRWLISYLLAALIVGLIDQIDRVPEVYCYATAVKSCIPIREYVLGALTLIARGLDVYKHEAGKLTSKTATPKGIYPF